ncbi:hypothetical protein [Weissella soli]|uniref:Uncharacterized protein n=1 Tax=Weissella soli TaxID=155866 RepID=A0A288QTN5_9LACO|nr:hypothetical protein [Weissella soli]AOT56418.1 hypothetical protein WSWS_00782 [Weissella soli]NKY82869.1 hypothetical protein [Weissella soli]RDL11986.1 hypothetical protein DFP99_0410 [Weissella soli]GEN92784.1 hypothetical protein WSO01_03960 [Weissella soli]
MPVTVYSFSHRSSALSALKSVTEFFELNQLPYNVVQMKDSESLPVDLPTMRQICAAEDPETTIFKNPRGMSIDDWTVQDIIASPNKSLKSPLTVEFDEAAHVTHVMAGINQDMLGLFIPHDRRKQELADLLAKADSLSD